MEISKIYNTIDRIIQEQKIARRNNDYLTLMLNAEAMLEYLPALIDYSVTQESEYRKFEAKLSDEFTGDKRNTSSYCETQAKSSDFYKELQKAKLFQELIYNLVNMSKMLAKSVNNEFNVN